MDDNNNGVNYGSDPINNGVSYGPDPVNNGVNYGTDSINNGGQQYVDPNMQPPVYNDVSGQQSGGSNGLAIASLVCGILSIVGGCCIACSGYILGILGIVFGCVGKNKADDKGKKLAKAGFICGIVGLVVSIINSVLGVVLQLSTSGYNY